MYLILAKFRYDWVKIVDFLIKGHFWSSPHWADQVCMKISSTFTAMIKHYDIPILRLVLLKMGYDEHPQNYKIGIFFVQINIIRMICIFEKCIFVIEQEPSCYLVNTHARSILGVFLKAGFI